MSLRLLITAAIAGLVLAAPGAATAQEIVPGGVPTAGDACDPAVDMEYVPDADGRDLACGEDGTWALVDAEEVPDETGAAEDPAGEESPDAPPADEPVEDTEGTEDTEDTEGSEGTEDLDGQACTVDGEIPGDSDAWVCTTVYAADCEVDGYVYRAVDEDGTVDMPEEQAAQEEACDGAEPSEGPAGEDPGTVPEEVPEGEAPDTECGESNEGDTDKGVICVCLDGDYGWYHSGSWHFYQDIWYWSHSDYYWYYLGGSWLKADDGTVAGIEDAAATPDRKTQSAQPVADKSAYLPLTGAPLAGLVAAALALTGAGGAAWWFTRRRRAHAEE